MHQSKIRLKKNTPKQHIISLHITLSHNRFKFLFLSLRIFFFSAGSFLSPACFLARGPSDAPILNF